MNYNKPGNYRLLLKKENGFTLKERGDVKEKGGVTLQACCEVRAPLCKGMLFPVLSSATQDWRGLKPLGRLRSSPHGGIFLKLKNVFASSVPADNDQSQSAKN